jgi:hypothetical protein
MRGAIAVLVVIAWPAVASAHDNSIELEVRVARSAFGMRAERLSGSGVHEYYGAQSLSVSSRDEGYRRPTFTVVNVAVGATTRYLAIFATAGGGWGSADEASPAGYQPALNAGASRLLTVGIEPRVRVSFETVSFALGVHAAIGWISAPFRELHPQGPCRTSCGGRASGNQGFFTPRAIVTWTVVGPRREEKTPAAVTLSAFGGFDPLYQGPKGPAIEFGLAVGLSAIGSRS